MTRTEKRIGLRSSWRAVYFVVNTLDALLSYSRVCVYDLPVASVGSGMLAFFVHLRIFEIIYVRSNTPK
jgi:hypothetical protein